MIQVKSYGTPPILEIRPGVSDEAPASQVARCCAIDRGTTPVGRPAQRHRFALYLDAFAAHESADYLLQHAEWGTLRLPQHRPGQPIVVGRYGSWVPLSERTAVGAVVAHYEAVEYRDGEPLTLAVVR